MLSLFKNPWRADSSAGFSLVEVLIATALTGFLATVGYRQLASIGRSQNTLSAQREVDTRLRLLIDEVKRTFRNRTIDPVGAPTTAFYSSSATPCQGLKITTQDTKLNVNVVTEYTTECVPYQIKQGAAYVDFINLDPKEYPLNGELNCQPHFLPRVVITETKNVFPIQVSTRYLATQPSPDFPASLVCFRLKGADIQVEVAGLSGAGKEVRQLSQRTVLSTRDKSTGIEYLSPQ